MADVYVLREQLRRERQVIEAEKRTIESVSTDIGSLSDRLLQSAWRDHQQWRNIDLLMGSRISPEQCAVRVANMEKARFRKGARLENAGHQAGDLEAIGELFSLLQSEPDILARVMVYADSCKLDTRLLVDIVLGSVFGNHVLPNDEIGVLRLLDCLLAAQLPACRQPRMFFRGVACAFTGLLSLFSEGLLSAKIYLAEALRDVVGQLLLDDERFFEFEPAKLYGRLSESQRHAWFTEDMCVRNDCDEAMQELDVAAAKVASYSMLMMKSLLINIPSMPVGLRWLAARLQHHVLQLQITKKPEESPPFLADMLFGCCVSPAIAMPEASIVTADTQISEKARYNLTQVARVIQGAASAVVAESCGQNLPSHLKTVYEKFDMSIVVDFFNKIVEGIDVEQPPPIASLEGLYRTDMYITEKELAVLLAFFQRARLPLSSKSLPANLTSLLDQLEPLALMYGASSGRSSPQSSKSWDRSDNAGTSRQSKAPRKSSYQKLPSVMSPTTPTRPVHGGVRLNRVRSEDLGNPDEVMIIPLPSAKPCGTVRLLTIDQILRKKSSTKHKEQSSSSPRLSSSLEHPTVPQSTGDHQSSTFIEADKSSNEANAVSGDCSSSREPACPENLPSQSVTQRSEVVNSAGAPGESGALPTGRTLYKNESTPTPAGHSPGRDRSEMVRTTVDRAHPLAPSPDIPFVPDSSVGDRSHSARVQKNPGNVLLTGESSKEMDLASWNLLSPSSATPTNSKSEKSALSLSLNGDSALPRSLLADDLLILPNRIGVERRESNLSTSSEDSQMLTSATCPSTPTPPMRLDVAVECASSSFSTDRESDSSGSDNRSTPSRSRQASSNCTSPEKAPSQSRKDTIDRQRVGNVEQLSKSDTYRDYVILPSPIGTSPGDALFADGPFRRNRLGSEANMKALWSQMASSRIGSLVKRGLSVPAGIGAVSLGKDRVMAASRKVASLSSATMDWMIGRGRSGSGLVVKESSPSPQGETETADEPLKELSPEMWEEWPLFGAMRRRLSSLLSEPETAGVGPGCFSRHGSHAPTEKLLAHSVAGKANPGHCLIELLKSQLSKAKFLNQLELVTELHDTIHLLMQMPPNSIAHLITCVHLDYRDRSVFLAYLCQVKHNLLCHRSYLVAMLQQVERHRESCMQFFTATFVRLFLEKHNSDIDHFVVQFEQAAKPEDKAALMDEFLSEMNTQLEDEPIWNVIGSDELQHAQRAVERTCFAKVYSSAFHIGGDEITLQDQVLHDQISHLAGVMTVDHPDLQIAPIYCHQAPWPSAVDILPRLGLAKAPTDKLAIIQCCCRSIMLSLSSAAKDISHQDENDSDLIVGPGADDFFPILVFVILQANPPFALSSITYVNTFLGERMFGEQAYWWTQFQTAVEFIRGMD